MPCSNGYSSSMTEIGLPSAYRLAKSSRSSMRATVVLAVSRRIDSMSSGSSHSELYRTSVRSRSSTVQNWSSNRSA